MQSRFDSQISGEREQRAYHQHYADKYPQLPVAQAVHQQLEDRHQHVQGQHQVKVPEIGHAVIVEQPVDELLPQARLRAGIMPYHGENGREDHQRRKHSYKILAEELRRRYHPFPVEQQSSRYHQKGRDRPHQGRAHRISGSSLARANDIGVIYPRVVEAVQQHYRKARGSLYI